MTVVSRAYNQFCNEPFGLIRKSSDTTRLADEIQYYRHIQRDINKAMFFPRLVASHIGPPHWMLLERYDYKNLGQHFMEDWTDWPLVFEQLNVILNQFATFGSHVPAQGMFIEEMLIQKTEREYQALTYARPDVSSLFGMSELILNDTAYRNFVVVWPTIRRYIEKNMMSYENVMIHGDMCFSNILYSPETQIFKFIDPRGSFGEVGIYGDQRYDIAKLYHSVDGSYEFLINDRYTLTDLGMSNYRLTLVLPEERGIALKHFEDTFLYSGKFVKKDIKIIQGCIFIGMCARHYDDAQRQVAMYLTGIRLLNEALSL